MQISDDDIRDQIVAGKPVESPTVPEVVSEDRNGNVVHGFRMFFGITIIISALGILFFFVFPRNEVKVRLLKSFHLERGHSFSNTSNKDAIQYSKPVELKTGLVQVKIIDQKCILSCMIQFIIHFLLFRLVKSCLILLRF